MGRIAEIGNQTNEQAIINQLIQVRKQARQIAGQIINLATSYKSVKSNAIDEDDNNYLDSQLQMTINSIKQDMDTLDSSTRTIVNQVIDGIFGERA